MSEYRYLLLAKIGSIAKLTLNRPDKLNALNDDMLKEFQDVLDSVDMDRSVRVLVITGAGRAFCSGYDIGSGDSRARSVEEWRAQWKFENDVLWRIWRLRIPVIAAVNGYCIGLGCDLAAVCDITLAEEEAEFGEPEVQFQASPSFWIIPWVLGMKKAKELLLLGDRITATEAERVGLVTKVVPGGSVAARAHELAVKLAKMPPPGVELTKVGLNGSYEARGFASAMSQGMEIATLVMLSQSAEAKEFFAVAAREGMKEAFKWRDAHFATLQEEGSGKEPE